MLSVNDIEIKPTMFPDNTSQVWKLNTEKLLEPFKDEPVPFFNIRWDFEHEGEIMHLVQLRMLLSSIHKDMPIVNLFMPYLPYGRQDKSVSNEETFALTAFAKVINNLGFDRVTTLDAHSSRFKRLVNKAVDLFPAPQILKARQETDSEVYAYPDLGAKNRYAKILIPPYVIGHKVRDQKTGWITKYDLQIPDGVSIEGKKVLIVDDICDGGMTFILLAKDLLKAGAKEVNLYVTHGIFSKGLKPLRNAGITYIYSKEGIHI